MTLSLLPASLISITNNTMSQKIRIKLKSYDHTLVEKSAEKIVKNVNSGTSLSGSTAPLMVLIPVIKTAKPPSYSD